MKFKAMVLLAIFVVACGPGEQVQVQRYLARTDRSVEQFVRLFRQLDDLGGKLRQDGRAPLTRARAAALAASLGPRLKELRSDLDAAAEGVRQLPPPPSARKYSEILGQGIEHANRALQSGDELLSELGRGAQASLTNVAGLLGELIRSLEQTGKCAREAELERQRLIDEFQLKTGPDGLVLE